MQTVMPFFLGKQEKNRPVVRVRNTGFVGGEALEGVAIALA